MKAATIPNLKIITQPKVEYKIGETISFNVSSPNYSKKVEYRVNLYNYKTKKTTELWNTPSTGYYYKGLQPIGNTQFTITLTTLNMEEGAYNLTVLTRAIGSKKGYDSFIKTNAFNVVKEYTTSSKPKEIKDIINVSLQSSNYKLPQKIIGTAYNGKIRPYPIIWDKTEVDTSQVATNNYQGTVEGYDKKINLTLIIHDNITPLVMSDTTKPVLEKVEADKTQVTFGEEIQFTVYGKDDVSGI